ncbi:MAG TPA: M18 family aminopeptidase [Candidatus Rifleibacterium sp.]|nr:M18 family aminopeptidase [Candidatus Rifleibacterium sp.]HPT44593.1 M18 family aminopeptidase [Candidatus Rifleibacterium sp.]
MSEVIEFARQLIDFCYASPTAFHAVSTTRALLESQKFQELAEADAWKIKAGGRYFIIRNDSALLAFVVGSKPAETSGFRVVGAHTDSPCFRIKPMPEMVAEEKYLKLNSEVYGGPILSTWFDRPLAIAGRVACRSSDQLNPTVKLVNIKRPVCIIPNIAIHMNPDANNGFVPNKQTDLLPMLGQISQKLEEKGFLQNLLATELKVKASDILDFDLFLYEFEKGSVIGAHDEFISAGRIDNLASVLAGVQALCAAGKPSATCVMACFDHEEVGSSTRQGADSQILADLLERVVLASGGGRGEFFRAMARSFIVSADGAHAVHPNMGGKADPTSRPMLNGGVVIKLSASRSYTSDAVSGAAFLQVCEKAGVKTQRFVNRSDMRGGSTIGPISSTHVGIPSVDVGIPMLAMHSIRELCGVEDSLAMYKALREFYKS